MGWASRHALLAHAVNQSLGGVSVTWGAVSGTAILEQNAELIVEGNVISIEYMLHNLPTADFGNLAYGSQIQVDGAAYEVRDVLRVGDGRYCMVSLSKT